MSYDGPFISSDKISDEDNHPENLHWWEKAPVDLSRRRGRCGRRNAPDSDSDSPYQSDGDFVQNPDPDEVNRSRPLSGAALEMYLAKMVQREAAAEARKEQKAVEREQRVAARRMAQIMERAAKQARADNLAA